MILLFVLSIALIFWFYRFIVSAADLFREVYKLVTSGHQISNIEEKYVLVTGCDTGFGRALALKLVSKGVMTLAACLTEEGERNLKNAVDGSEKMVPFRMDVTSQESVEGALIRVRQLLGDGRGLWALVNNAGILGATAPTDWLSIDDWQKPFDVNCLGMIRVTQAFVPLIKRERGRILIITSMAGRLVMPFCGPYCASKYGAEAYADILRGELVPFGVTVHILEPGFMGGTNLTHQTDLALHTLWKHLSPQVQSEYGERYPQKAADYLDRSIRLLSSRRTHLVPDACMHAITSAVPKQRYIIGLDSNLFLRIVWVPTVIFDLLKSLLLVITGYPLPSRGKRRENESG